MKKLIESAILGIVIICILSIGHNSKESKLQGSETTYCDYVLRDFKSRNDYIITDCVNKGAIGDVSISEVYSKILDCKNHDQNKLVEAYNANGNVQKSDKINSDQGVCWAAATVSLLEYYGASTSPYTKPSVNEMFYYTIKTGRERLYNSFPCRRTADRVSG